MPKPSLWQGIAETLTSDLASGQYRPGDKLPTEAELAERFAVNRHTIRRALAALSETGLLHSKRGAGVFVAAKPTPYRIGKRVRFHENIHADGHQAEKRILRLETRTASKTERAALKLSATATVHAYEGLSLVDGTPMAHFTSVFPATRFADLPAALQANSSVTAALKTCGLDDYIRAETRVVAASATPVQANHLRCKPGTALLRTTGINTDLDGTPVEYGQTWFTGDRVELLLHPDR